MRHDQEIVELFLRGYNAQTGSTYRVQEWSDRVIRNTKAVEAIAVDDVGKTLALEHTLIQPFSGEKQDAQPFLQVFGPLEKDPSLALPGFWIGVEVPVGGVKQGVNWKILGEQVKKWFRAARATFPNDRSYHTVPNQVTHLSVGIYKMPMKDASGKVCILRTGSQGTLLTYIEVVRKALSDKLPKLTNTPADRHMLLLEYDNVTQGPIPLRDALIQLEPEYPDLSNVDEIWAVDTVVMRSESLVVLISLWPSLQNRWLTVPF